jgi:hypothetical protein
MPHQAIRCADMTSIDHDHTEPFVRAPSEQSGLCDAIPEACTMEAAAKVCGCDGNTHSSECGAAFAGVSIK